MKFREFLLNESEKVQPKTRKELEKIIIATIEEQGAKCDLNFIDTSLITDMKLLFSPHSLKIGLFDGDISGWDVSNVTDMSYMFSYSNFTGKNTDFSKWDTSKVTNFQGMFMDSKFKPSLNLGMKKWNTKNVRKRNSWLGGFSDMFKTTPRDIDAVEKIAKGWGFDFNNEADADVLRNMW